MSEIKSSDLHAQWLNDPAYREAYDAMDGEFSIASALIEARSRDGVPAADFAGEELDTGFSKKSWGG